MAKTRPKPRLKDSSRPFAGSSAKAAPPAKPISTLYTAQIAAPAASSATNFRSG